jgi:DNA (cytosine-5)-methyltransferase 1
MPRYLSLFSGIGGLESEADLPILCCEKDPACARLLASRFPGVEVHPDVTTLRPPAAEVIAGGWPCQDLSVAGLRRGLAGERSGLFFALLRIAREAGAHTVLAENVPNLLSLEGGRTFATVLDALAEAGFPYVSWRRLNARAFGLPHQRVRVLLAASRHREIALALHRPLPPLPPPRGEGRAAGFYWTGGLQSICYSEGFVPTLKVGSSLSIPSPPALHFDDVVRKATPAECLRFQGFDPAEFRDMRPKDVYRATGNAVAVPVGRFVFGCLRGEPPGRLRATPAAAPFRDGYREPGGVFEVTHPAPPLSADLAAFIDREDRTPLAPRAAAGLLARLSRSGKPCPPDLFALLSACARADGQERRSGHASHRGDRGVHTVPPRSRSAHEYAAAPVRGRSRAAKSQSARSAPRRSPVRPSPK